MAGTQGHGGELGEGTVGRRAIVGLGAALGHGFATPLVWLWGEGADSFTGELV